MEGQFKTWNYVFGIEWTFGHLLSLARITLSTVYKMYLDSFITHLVIAVVRALYEGLGVKQIRHIF
jgi:hypothetical protein